MGDAFDRVWDYGLRDGTLDPAPGGAALNRRFHEVAADALECA